MARWERFNHVGASLHFLVQSLQRVCAVQLGPVLLGEVQMRQNLPLVFGAVGWPNTWPKSP